MSRSSLFNTTFTLGFLYNFVMSLIFTNNALYPLYVTYEGGEATMIGAFMGVYLVSAVLSRPFIGKMLDRHGPVPVMVLGALCLGLPSLGFLPFMAPGLHPVEWLLRVIQGVGIGAHFSATFTMAPHIAPPGRRNEAVAMYGLSGLAGNLVGPVAGEYILYHFGFFEFFLTMAVISLVATGIALRIRMEWTPVSSSGTKVVRAVLGARGMVLVFALAGLLAFVYSTPGTFLAAAAKEKGIVGFGLYFTGYGLAGMVVRFVGSHWGDRHGLRKVLAPSFLLYGVGIVLAGISTTALALLGSGLICGIAHGLAFPAVTSLGYSLAPPRYAGSAMAYITGMMDVGSVVAALGGGPLAQVFGYGLVFPLAGVAALLAAGLVGWDALREMRSLRSTG